jgi:hypothetical protein
MQGESRPKPGGFQPETGVRRAPRFRAQFATRSRRSQSSSALSDNRWLHRRSDGQRPRAGIERGRTRSVSGRTKQPRRRYSEGGQHRCLLAQAGATPELRWTQHIDSARAAYLVEQVSHFFERHGCPGPPVQRLSLALRWRAGCLKQMRNRNLLLDTRLARSLQQ